jgi:hypothetical protein
MPKALRKTAVLSERAAADAKKTGRRTTSSAAWRHRQRRFKCCS